MRTPRPAASTIALSGLTDIWEFLQPFCSRVSIHSMAIRAAYRHVDALAAGHDAAATRAGFRLVLHLSALRCALASSLLLFAGFEKVDADLVAIDPSQLAAAISQTCGGQQQEKFLELQSLDGAV